MKSTGIMTMCCALFFAGAALAAGEQEADGEGARRGPAMNREEVRPPREGMNMAGNWVCRLLLQDETLDALGIEGGARSSLVAGLTDISSKMKDLQKKIVETGMEQGKMMREIMDKPGADISPVIAKVKEIGDMRTEQSILSTKVFVVIRDNLTKEQHKRVREFVMKEGRQRWQARREFNGDMERRRPRLEGGRQFRRGMREGHRGRAAQQGAQEPAPDGGKADGKNAEK